MNMENYSQEFKEAVLKRLLPPENATVIQLANEYQIHENTLRSWCKKQDSFPRGGEGRKRRRQAPVPTKNNSTCSWKHPS